MSLIDSAKLRIPTFDSLDLSHIADKIFCNETSRKIENLLFWNPKEKFPSLGIAHFVWLPKNYDQTIRLDDVFSRFLGFCEAQGIEIPSWLQEHRTCPWTKREEFEEFLTKESEMVLSVRIFLDHQKQVQAEFVVVDFIIKLPQVIKKMEGDDQDLIVEYCNTLLNDPRGCFALIDYSNFKGFGLGNGSAAYNHQNWGLKQVIERALTKDWRLDPLGFFVESAKETLENRVVNAPIEQKTTETSYIPGWFNRLDRYQLDRF